MDKKEASLEFAYANLTDDGMLLEKPPVKKGRRKRLNVRLAKIIYFLARKQFTDKEICQIVGVSETRLNVWKKSESFRESLAKCKAEVDDQVEKALLQRALGYEYEEKMVERDHNGRTKQRVTKKHLAPDVSAGRLWLINRRPKKWRSDFAPEQDGNKLLIDLIEYAKKRKNGHGEHIEGGNGETLRVIR